MKKNVDAALRRKEKMEQRGKKQAKVLLILGIVMAVVVVIFTAVWAYLGIRTLQTRDLSAKEARALFDSNEALPDKDDTIIGEWYFYNDDRIVGKYVFDETGKLEVYDWGEEAYTLRSSASYRVRERAGALYVKPDEGGSVVTYDYKIEYGDSLYYMSWTHNQRKWMLVKLAS